MSFILSRVCVTNSGIPYTLARLLNRKKIFVKKHKNYTIVFPLVRGTRFNCVYTSKNFALGFTRNESVSINNRDVERWLKTL